jgi:hypothetical protein
VRGFRITTRCSGRTRVSRPVQSTGRATRRAAERERWAYMKAAFVAAILLVGITKVHAGGDYAEGLVSEFSGSEGVYRFHFAQTPGRAPLVGIDCQEFDVAVQYPPAPWYSWLPWVEAFHPTLGETKAAAEYLKQAAENRRVVNFGYMGSGLFPGGQRCHFETHGLELSVEPGTATAVLAHHKPA